MLLIKAAQTHICFHGFSFCFLQSSFKCSFFLHRESKSAKFANNFLLKNQHFHCIFWKVVCFTIHLDTSYNIIMVVLDIKGQVGIQLDAIWNQDGCHTMQMYTYFNHSFYNCSDTSLKYKCGFDFKRANIFKI